MSYVWDNMDRVYSEKSMIRDHHYNAVAHRDSSSSSSNTRRDRHYQSCPSFSSTLLDAIYHSIDDPHPRQQQQQQHHQLFFHQETTTHINQCSALKGHEPAMVTNGRRQRACEIEKCWMDQRGNEKVKTVPRSSIADLRMSPRSFRNSSSSSSDWSSNKGGFSSSESSDYSSRSTESKSRPSSSCCSMKKLKPIRTSISVDRPDRPCMIDTLGENYNAHKQGGVVKAKSKAMKIYAEFKRVSGNNSKQPVSPGSKLASFLNSIFSAKKAKLTTKYDEDFPVRVPGSGYSSTCSSASSFSRSCLSKTPSSRGKFAKDGAKRSVRFCPVSMIVDEDRRPCGQKTIVPGDRRQESGSKMVTNHPKTRGNRDQEEEEEEEEEEDGDDGASCASSDLFELENLSGIGMGGYRYTEELPVYETTNADTNRAIASGLIV